MKRQKVEREQSGFLIDSPPSDTGGLLKTGVFSLLLHIVFIIFLILSLKTVTTKASLRVYRVAIQPFSSQKNPNPPPLQAVPCSSAYSRKTSNSEERRI